MKTLLIVAGLLLGSCQSIDNTSTRVDLMYGQRDFASSDWEQTDNHKDAAGVRLDLCGRDGWGVELGFVASDDTSDDSTYVNRDVNDTTTHVNELYVGVRQNHMTNDWLQLHMSGGLSVFVLDTDVDLSYSKTHDDSDTAYSPYAQVGASVFLTHNLSAGVSYKYNFFNEDADIFITNPELDGGLLFLTLGLSF